MTTILLLPKKVVTHSKMFVNVLGCGSNQIDTVIIQVFLRKLSGGCPNFKRENLTVIPIYDDCIGDWFGGPNNTITLGLSLKTSRS